MKTVTMEIGRIEKSISLRELAKELVNQGIDCRAHGEDIRIDKFCSIKKIEEAGLYYLTANVVSKIAEIKKSIIISNQIIPDLENCNSFLVLDEPQLAYYKLCRIFFRDSRAYDIHSTAIIHPEAVIDPDVYIGPFSIIGKCIINKGTKIHPHVVIYDHSILGQNVTVEAGSYIGATGVAWIWDKNGERIVQPQVGGVVIGDQCFIGTDVTIVRGSLNEFTQIGHHTLIAHGTKIAHGVDIGAYCHLANNVTIAGSAVIGDRCFLGAASVVSSNIRLSEKIIVGAGAVVVNHFDEGGVVIAGVPAKIKGPVSTHKGVPQGASVKLG
jgi:UDP-3-O-[3-hydroxymyristoyl] glucosamine N-acyltransferase